MKILTIVLLSMVSAHAANAQTFAPPSSVARSAMVARGEANYPSASYPSTLAGNSLAGSDGVSRECLREKATKKLVCHTRAGWQAIAKRLESEKPGND